MPPGLHFSTLAWRCVNRLLVEGTFTLVAILRTPRGAWGLCWNISEVPSDLTGSQRSRAACVGTGTCGSWLALAHLELRE